MVPYFDVTHKFMNEYRIMTVFSIITKNIIVINCRHQDLPGQSRINYTYMILFCTTSLHNIFMRLISFQTECYFLIILNYICLRPKHFFFRVNTLIIKNIKIKKAKEIYYNLTRSYKKDLSLLNKSVSLNEPYFLCNLKNKRRKMIIYLGLVFPWCVVCISATCDFLFVTW